MCVRIRARSACTPPVIILAAPEVDGKGSSGRGCSELYINILTSAMESAPIYGGTRDRVRDVTFNCGERLANDSGAVAAAGRVNFNFDL